jgi:hypothetical protein
MVSSLRNDELCSEEIIGLTINHLEEKETKVTQLSKREHKAQSILDFSQLSLG